jgi:hypothetical protein
MQKLVAMAAAAMLAFGARAEAASIATVDQQNNAAANFFTFGGFAGQSFTPTLNRVDAFEFILGDTSIVTLELYEGAGFGGTKLASSAPVAFGDPFQIVHFDLSAALTPGQVYTVRLRPTDFGGQFADDFNVRFSDTSAYAGGTMYWPDHSTSPAADMYFIEGLHAATAPDPDPLPVPEPASFALVFAGLAGLGLARRGHSRDQASLR